MSKYCLITQTVRAYTLDGEDPDTYPDKIPANGRVIFTPILGKGETVQDDGETLVLVPIEARITNGEIYHRGTLGVSLYSSDDTGTNPVRYKATYRNLVAGSHSLTIRETEFTTVPGGTVNLPQEQQND